MFFYVIRVVLAVWHLFLDLLNNVTTTFFYLFPFLCECFCNFHYACFKHPDNGIMNKAIILISSSLFVLITYGMFKLKQNYMVNYCPMARWL